MAARRRKRRTQPNYYASPEMKREDKAALRRAAKMQGLADEIALIRVEIKKALAEEDADKLKVLADAVKTLTRAVLAQKKAMPEGDDFLSVQEDALYRMQEIFWPEFNERRRKWREEERARFREETGWKPPAEDAGGEASDDGLKE